MQQFGFDDVVVASNTVPRCAVDGFSFSRLKYSTLLALPTSSDMYGKLLEILSLSFHTRHCIWNWAPLLTDQSSSSLVGHHVSTPQRNNINRLYQSFVLSFSKSCLWSNILEWGHLISTFERQNVLLAIAGLEGTDSYKRTDNASLSRYQGASGTIKQVTKSKHAAKSLWSWNTRIPNDLELQYETKSSMSSVLTFQDGQNKTSQLCQGPLSLTWGKTNQPKIYSIFNPGWGPEPRFRRQWISRLPQLPPPPSSGDQQKIPTSPSNSDSSPTNPQ